MSLKNFDYSEFMILTEEEKQSYIKDYRIKMFRQEFNWRDDVSYAEFNTILSNDRKVTKWLKALNMDIQKMLVTPFYANIQDVPNEVRNIILKDKNAYDEITKELSSDMQKMIDSWNKSNSLYESKRREKFKTISNYFLVTTIEIKDIPLDKKRKLIKLSSIGDVKSIQLAKDERKVLVSEYKKELFKILLDNNGEFPAGYDNPFLEKFQA